MQRHNSDTLVVVKAKRKAVRPASPKIVCPSCEQPRDTPDGVLTDALAEFYGTKTGLSFFRGLGADLKREYTRSLQAIWVLGHFTHPIQGNHPKRPHECYGLLDAGLFQAVELLNRGVTHAATGSLSPAYALIRMALEVGVRSVFEESVYGWTSGKHKPPRTAKGSRLGPYLKDCKAIAAAHGAYRSCSLQMLNVSWPPPDRGRPSELDPGHLGWEKTLGYLREATFLEKGSRLDEELEEVYGELSVWVHQRKGAVEASQFTHRERGDSADRGDWVIRGLRPVTPAPGSIDHVRRVVDILIALTLRFQGDNDQHFVIDLPLEERKGETSLRWDGLPLVARELRDLEPFEDEPAPPTKRVQKPTPKPSSVGTPAPPSPSL